MPHSRRQRKTSNVFADCGGCCWAVVGLNGPTGRDPEVNNNPFGRLASTTNKTHSIEAYSRDLSHGRLSLLMMTGDVPFEIVVRNLQHDLPSMSGKYPM